jgi:hydroxyacylglutathione hydrolase
MTQNRFKDIDVNALSDLQQHRQDLFLLDVREPFELVAFGAIPGITNIPMGALVSRMPELPADANHPIAVICQSGIRSREVAQYLISKGFTSVHNLVGGTSAWRNAGRPVTTGSQMSPPHSGLTKKRV